MTPEHAALVRKRQTGGNNRRAPQHVEFVSGISSAIRAKGSWRHSPRFAMCVSLVWPALHNDWR
jgi:hypothetical protein